MGDFVKGNQYQNYPDKIAKGILLHREIDRYTDSHPTVGISKDRLRVKYRHYAGVIVDMFYDHFLAKNFEEFHSMNLKDFTEHHFQHLMNFINEMPPRAQNMLPYMVKNNWLLAYAKLEGIQRALTGMSRRTKFESKMDEAIQDLIENYDGFETEFRVFFPQIIDHISQFREDLITSQ